LFCPSLDTNGSNPDCAKYKGSAMPIKVYTRHHVCDWLYKVGCYNVLGIIVPHSPTGPTLSAAASKVGTGKRIRNNNKGDCTS
jgi:hypothetical protein